MVAAIGPLWSWHEVWLVGFGGTLLAVFPRLMASAFAGYYLALFLILWNLILRGISLEVGGHINDRLWQGFWDFVFVFSNFLLAILFGAAAGNVARGVPLDADGNFSMPFFTNFSVRGRVGLLDWYTISIAIFAATILAAHGATYLTLKTEGPVHDRSSKYAKYLWAATVPLFLAISVESQVVRPNVVGHAIHNQFCWLGLIMILIATGVLISGFSARRELRAFLGVEFDFGRLIDNWRCSYFPRDALFHSGAREFADCLFCRCQRKLLAYRIHLVAGGFCSGDRIFRLHFATLYGKSQRKAGHSGILLTAVMQGTLPMSGPLRFGWHHS